MKLISNSFIPNFEKDDAFLALKIIFQPWRWLKGKEISPLEREFKEKFAFKYAFAFNGGRSALLAILKAISLQKDEEVFIQCFTCNAAINPILSLGAKPIFVDIDRNLNLDLKDLKEKFKLAKKPRVIIVQHTFGFPAQIEEIKNFAKENNLILIEDCAHSLGAKYKGNPLGSFGNFAFFSLGRDKIISSVYGGIATTNSEIFAEELENFQKSLKEPDSFWTFKSLLLLITFSLALPFYSFFDLGKLFLFLLRKSGLTPPAVYSSENKGKLAKAFPKKMSNALAILALHQLKKLEKFNNHRKKIALFYREKLRDKKNIKIIFSEKNEEIKPVFMRFPILVRKRKETLEKLKKENIYLEDGWAGSIIVPKASELEKFGYQKGSCPKAESIVSKIINLPTNIKVSEKEAERIIERLEY